MTILIDGVNGLADRMIVTSKDLSCRLYEVGFMRGLNKCYSIKSLMNESKIFLAFCDLIDPERSLPLGEFRNTFENIKLLTYGTASIGVLNELLKNINDPKGALQKTISMSLLLVTSTIETVKFFQKQFDIKELPFFTELSTQLGSYSVFQGDYNPVAYTFNKPKEAFYLMHCIWNLIADLLNYILAVNAANEDKAAIEKLLSTKNIIDRTGDIGKILLITLSASYASHIVFRVMNLSLQILAQLKTIAFD